METLRIITVIQKYIEKEFNDSDWNNLGELTGCSDLIRNHPRLLRALSFGDEDYSSCITDVLIQIFRRDANNLDLIIEFYQIRDWGIINEPESSTKAFAEVITKIPEYWKQNYVKAFISHLATEKHNAKRLKSSLDILGISCFVAHEDIEPAKEWMPEIEAGLDSMDILIAMITPKFKESNWTDQEIGYAFGRHVDIIPIRLGADPHGFLGKYQGIQAKDKIPDDVAFEILGILLLTRY
jgi:hypothetical protein